MIAELEGKAPLLLRICSSIVSVNDHRNQHKCGASHYPGICMATAVLLKERNREVTGLQSLMYLLFFSSHVEKKVILYSLHDYVHIFHRYNIYRYMLN